MLDWIFQNREWVFSGVGVSALAGALAFLKHIRGKNKPAALQPSSAMRGFAERDLKEILKGRWVGTVQELHFTETEGTTKEAETEGTTKAFDVQRLTTFRVSWKFTVLDNKVHAESIAQFEKNGKKIKLSYSLSGYFVHGRFLKLEYVNDKSTEITFGSEIIQLDDTGEGFRGWFVGFTADRSSFIFGPIEARRER